MSFGAALKQARESQGLSTQDVALRTKIRGDYLRALEDGNTSLLPERTFARSYLQRYARELSLDPAPLLADFDRSVPASAEMTQSLRGPAARPGRKAGAGGRSLNPALLAGVATGVIILGAGGYYALGALKPAPAPAAVTPAVTPEPTPAPVTTVRLSVSSVPTGARVYLDNRDLGVTPVRSFPVDARHNAQLRVEAPGRAPLKETVDLSRSRNLRAQLRPTGQNSALVDLNAARAARAAAAAAAAAAPTTPAATTPAPTAPTPTTPATTPPATTPPAAAQAVNVTFSGASWTRVTDAAGRVLYQGTPPAGTVKGFPQGVTIRTGNAGAVRVGVNGAAPAPLGQVGQVVTRTF
ncbi:RodZ domain-containing protein [Deinococcus caeni]|uniref:Cytoskeleton protein RodZ n=1 Tax=Deinococcus caeni TaxID=569127 RepID=A0ABP9UFW2_9DEIO